MVSARYALPLETRARAAVTLERDGAADVFGSWRSDPQVAEVRWSSGGRPRALRAGLDRLLDDFTRTGDPSAGLAVMWLVQALVLARMDEGPEVRT
jgi:hypothetical protein